MTLDVNQLRADLESQLLSRIGILQRSAISPEIRNIDEIITDNSSNHKEYKQSPSANISEKEVILLKLFGEFTKKDEGKELAKELGKFSRFVQSEVAKSSKKS